MARATLLNLIITTIIIFSQKSCNSLENREIAAKRRERLSHLHFYFHDLLNVTAVIVAEAASTGSYRYKFGEVLVIDDPLTVGPELGSEAVGRAQGMYASADTRDAGLWMEFNLVFVDGSTISVAGRNAVLEAEREMPVVGGTGAFRFARGYARTRTYSLDLDMGYAVEEYDVYVYHY